MASAIMHQPLGTAPVGCTAFLLRADEITPSAWQTHDDKLCVPRQLAEVLDITMNEAMGWFDEFLNPEWRLVGVSPDQIKEMCHHQNRPLLVCAGQRCVDRYDPPQKTKGVKAVGFTCWRGHAYFYRDARTVATRSVSRVPVCVYA